MLHKAEDYDESQTVYIYGVKNINHQENNPNSTQWGSNEIYLARVVLERAEDFFDYQRWLYFSAGRWVDDVATASPVAHSIGPQATINYNPLSRSGGAREALNKSTWRRWKPRRAQAEAHICCVAKAPVWYRLRQGHQE